MEVYIIVKCKNGMIYMNRTKNLLLYRINGQGPYARQAKSDKSIQCDMAVGKELGQN